MKSQKQNEGTLLKLTVQIEENVVKAFQQMSKNTGRSVDDLVVIALKRFRAGHSDYEGVVIKSEA